jgi:glutamate-1-semialdehyde 2,1-aminomutase
MRAGLLTLQKMVRLNGYAVLAKRTEDFANNIRKGLTAQGANLEMDTFTSLFWLRGLSSGEKQNREGGSKPSGAPGVPLRSIGQIPKDQGIAFKKIFLNCLEKKIYLAPNAYEVGFISMAHDEGLLAEAAHSILSSIDA